MVQRIPNINIATHSDDQVAIKMPILTENCFASAGTNSDENEFNRSRVYILSKV